MAEQQTSLHVVPTQAIQHAQSAADGCTQNRLPPPERQVPGCDLVIVRTWRWQKRGDRCVYEEPPTTGVLPSSCVQAGYTASNIAQIVRNILYRKAREGELVKLYVRDTGFDAPEGLIYTQWITDFSATDPRIQVTFSNATHFRSRGLRMPSVSNLYIDMSAAFKDPSSNPPDYFYGMIRAHDRIEDVPEDEPCPTRFEVPFGQWLKTYVMNTMDLLDEACRHHRAPMLDWRGWRLEPYHSKIVRFKKNGGYLR